MGGLVGYNEGLITDSGSSATVEGKFAGGLVGISDGIITRSRASGAIFGQYSGRRVLGRTVKRTGFVIYGGGLAGVASNVMQSYATGPVNVQGQHYTDNKHSGGGGLIGHLTGTVQDSYALGAVSGEYTTGVGGLVGHHENFISTTSYATGAVASDGDTGSSHGGAVGSDNAQSRFNDLYWDVDTSRQKYGCGGDKDCAASGVSDAVLKAALPTGFDPQNLGAERQHQQRLSLSDRQSTAVIIVHNPPQLDRFGASVAGYFAFDLTCSPTSD